MNQSTFHSSIQPIAPIQSTLGAFGGAVAPLTFGSLFTGFGGLDLGLERAGLQCRWQVEIEDYPLQVLQRQFPDVPRFRDVREVGSKQLSPVDVIVGGFPCQDISSAGKGAGIEGARSGLWSEYYRIICELRPRYVIVENVEALRHRGRGLYRVLGDLAAAGFDAEWRVFSAAECDAPHLRQRLFVLAYPGSIRRGDGVQSEILTGLGPEEFGQWASDQPVESFARVRRRYVSLPTHLRVDDGLSAWLERPENKRTGAAMLKGYGNAVVPQLGEHVGRCVENFNRALTQSTLTSIRTH